MPLNTKRLNASPKTILLHEVEESEIGLVIHGQGTFLFAPHDSHDPDDPLTFIIYNRERSDGLEVSLSSTEFMVTRLSNGDKYKSQDPAKSRGLTTKSGAYYWFSLDAQNQAFYGGIGEARIETATYQYRFDPKGRLWEANKIFLESLVLIDLSEEEDEEEDEEDDDEEEDPILSIRPIRLLKNPITLSIPLKVKGRDALTMEDVATNAYLPHSALPQTGQTLYECVAGEKFTLNTSDFPDFSDAIEYSIRTPGMWCNTRLKEKATEFGKNPQPLETYLRITLGQNNGESPGIPYVMEIWPVGHYSPVHNHSGANAIIRVLSGTIHVSLFPYLCDDPKEGVDPFAEADFVEGDITWISETLNQVHQLRNLPDNKSACITIQCYMYDQADKIHYDYFDYLGDGNAKAQYEPDSDMDFVEFKNRIREEWNQRPKKMRKSL